MAAKDLFHDAVKKGLKDPSRKLYLAVPEEIYNTFFQSLLAKAVVQKYQIQLITYDPEHEVIVQWLS
jgi:XisH protein